jgi:hypothetical protein
MACLFDEALHRKVLLGTVEGLTGQMLGSHLLKGVSGARLGHCWESLLSLDHENRENTVDG